MRKPMTLCKISRAPALITLALVVAAVRPAHADGPLGAYIGGTLGRGEVETNTQTFPVFDYPGEFKQGNATLGAVLGIRPLRYVGAEIGYVDFGRPSGIVGTGDRDQVSMKAETAFGVLYLPVPIVDLYGKVGVAHLQVDVDNLTPPLPTYNCPSNGCVGLNLLPLVTTASRSSTNFAFAAGVQYKLGSLPALGSFALRAEYERFQFGGENPSQVSFGLTWTFF